MPDATAVSAMSAFKPDQGSASEIARRSPCGGTQSPTTLTPEERTRGKLVIISGPSGTGKTSICERLLQVVPRAEWSVSATTRARRGHEVEGRDYHFVSAAEFERMQNAGELLECAEYLGHWYGTPVRPAEQAVRAGRTIILEIDVQGAAQIAHKMPESVRIFVLPPTMQTLQARLAGRHTESAEIQRKRLERADGEIRFARDSGVYPHFITNDTVDDSVNRVLQILGVSAAVAAR